MASLPPSPLAHPDETLFEYIARYVELLKARECELGQYPGDGPTATEADQLIAQLQPLTLGNDATVSVMWNAFRSAVDTEMTWLFPEKDPIGESLTWALERVQESTGKLLIEYGPIKHEDLDRYVSLALVARAAKRQVRLKGNGINYRLVLARFFYWLGGGKRHR